MNFIVSILLFLKHFLFIDKNNGFFNYYNQGNMVETIEENKNEEEEDKFEQANNIKTKKKLILRTGDWYCGYCNNLNFAFRKECNICRLSKQFWHNS